MAKAKILEKIGECWNDVNVDPNGASRIQSNDKITLYKLSVQEKSRGEILNSSWNEGVNDCSNIIILRRDTSNDTKIMCRNEDLRDATDDVCEMISKWYTRLLYQYNISLYESEQVDTIKELMDRSIDPEMHIMIESASKFLGGITFNELTAIGVYKLRRNARVHKVKWSTQDVALKRLDIAGAQMTPECKEAVEKCIKAIYRS